jgi:hypothetical protein
MSEYNKKEVVYVLCTTFRQQNYALTSKCDVFRYLSFTVICMVFRRLFNRNAKFFCSIHFKRNSLQTQLDIDNYYSGTSEILITNAIGLNNILTMVAMMACVLGCGVSHVQR